MAQAEQTRHEQIKHGVMLSFIGAALASSLLHFVPFISP